VNTLILIKCSGELSNGRGYFDPGQKNSLLPLECDVLGPLHKPCQIAGWLNAVTHSEVSWSLLEKWISFLFDSFGSLFSFHSFGLNDNNFTIFCDFKIILKKYIKSFLNNQAKPQRMFYILNRKKLLRLLSKIIRPLGIHAIELH
jgi:hypothetical protein